MAWLPKLYEAETDKEEIWGKYSLEGGYRQDIVFDDADDDLVFYGKIVDSQNKGVPGVILNISAEVEDGAEIPLAYGYSGSDGNYLLSARKPPVPAVKYIIRAGTASV
jgi:hypothetical protein